MLWKIEKKIRIQKLHSLFFLLLTLLAMNLPSFPVFGASYTVDGYPIEVSLVPSEATLMLGEPIYLSFVVKNNSDQDLQILVGGDYRNSLGRPQSFKITVTGEKGQQVPQPEAGPDFGGILGPQKIAAQKSYTFQLFLPHWAAFEKTGVYSLTAERILKIGKYNQENWDQEKMTEMPVQARTAIKVVALDNKKMGQLITELGNTTLGQQYSARETAESAFYRLAYIQDERVIPYLVKAFETKSYDQQFRALAALAKFKTESALEILKRGMEIKGEDIIDETASPQLSDGLAENIRSAAAHALAVSPHPAAISFLLSKKNDTSEGVRITILHVLGKMNPEEAVPILKEISQDKSKMVREEAKRYLQIFSSATPQASSYSVRVRSLNDMYYEIDIIEKSSQSLLQTIALRNGLDPSDHIEIVETDPNKDISLRVLGGRTAKGDWYKIWRFDPKIKKFIWSHTTE